MSTLRALFEVARRDLVQRARSKAFLFTNLLTVVIILGIAPLIALEAGDPDPTPVGVVGEVAPEFEQALAAGAAGVDLEIDVRSVATVDEGEDALLAGDLAVVVAPGELIWAEEEGPRTRAAVVSALASMERSRLIQELGITAEEATALLAPEAPPSRILEPVDTDVIAGRIAAQVGTFILYMSIIIFGQFILLGVMEEKQSRVVEVVLSRVRPELLLAGKIIGIGLLGLGQVILIGAAVVYAATLIDLPDVSLPAIGGRVVATVAMWFLLGYALFSVMYGALGATVSKQEDVQGAAMIPTFLVIPGFAISIFSLEGPDALVPTIASYVPFTAPMVMPVRMAAGSVAVWEVALSVAILLVTLYALVKAAARIYGGAVLTIGPKVRLRDAWASTKD